METIRKHIGLLHDMGLTEQEEIYRLLTDRILKNITLKTNKHHAQLQL